MYSKLSNLSDRHRVRLEAGILSHRGSEEVTELLFLWLLKIKQTLGHQLASQWG